jgi:hypothetical protein
MRPRPVAHPLPNGPLARLLPRLALKPERRHVVAALLAHVRRAQQKPRPDARRRRRPGHALQRAQEQVEAPRRRGEALDGRKRRAEPGVPLKQAQVLDEGPLQVARLLQKRRAAVRQGVPAVRSRGSGDELVVERQHLVAQAALRRDALGRDQRLRHLRRASQQRPQQLQRAPRVVEARVGELRRAEQPVARGLVAHTRRGPALQPLDREGGQVEGHQGPHGQALTLVPAQLLGEAIERGDGVVHPRRALGRALRGDGQ